MSSQSLQVGSVSHAGIVVADIETVSEFFEDVIGLRRWYDFDRGARLRGLAVDDLLVELVQYPEGHPMQYRSTGASRMHLGFSVADVGVACARAKELGVEILEEPVTIGAATYCYLQGPEGLVVELVHYEGDLPRAMQLMQ